jgi:hypothetical protein
MEIVTCVVFGTMAAVQAVLSHSKASRRINNVVSRTSERHRPAPQRSESAEDLHIQ